MKLRKIFSKQKEKKNGFTLVELIVVLVILAILAAIMVPTLIGWIDKAKEKQAVLRANNLYKAAQAVASEWYAEGKELSGDTNIAFEFGDEVFELAGIPMVTNVPDVDMLYICFDNYTIVGMYYTKNSLYWVKGGTWTTDGTDFFNIYQDPYTRISINNFNRSLP